jgi:phosphoglycolate phosphatase
MKLILFDIDGTLIWPDGAGRAAMQRALVDVFGTAGPTDSLPMAGKTDWQIITELLTVARIEPTSIEAHLPQCYQAIARHMLDTTREREVRTCPGVPALLDHLSTRCDLVLGLLTGNLHVTAPIKLRAANLDPAFFLVGAYGNDGRDRVQLPAVAIARAEALTGLEVRGENVFIVGDTPADVTCGQHLGVTAIGVATGHYSLEALKAAGAKRVFPDLTNLDAVMHTIGQAKYLT